MHIYLHHNNFSLKSPCYICKHRFFLVSNRHCDRRGRNLKISPQFVRDILISVGKTRKQSCWRRAINKSKIVPNPTNRRVRKLCKNFTCQRTPSSQMQALTMSQTKFAASRDELDIGFHRLCIAENQRFHPLLRGSRPAPTHLTFPIHISEPRRDFRIATFHAPATTNVVSEGMSSIAA